MTRRISSPARSTFHILALGIAMTCLGVVATPASHAVTPGKATIASASTTPVVEMQLADEITRRLRRIGLNFNRARLPRPYDPEGEIC